MNCHGTISLTITIWLLALVSMIPSGVKYLEEGSCEGCQHPHEDGAMELTGFELHTPRSSDCVIIVFISNISITSHVDGFMYLVICLKLVLYSSQYLVL